MRIVTACFYSTDEPAAHLIRSARKNGLEPLVYGLGKPFHAHGADAQVVQLIPVLEALADDIVCITDCRDSLILAGEAEILRTFEEFKARLVMSTEKGCWPPEDEVLHGMAHSPLGYDFINAGQYIGERVYIIECLKFLVEKYRRGRGLDNSQAWWPLALIRKELDFSLDKECHLFQSMSSGETYTISKARVSIPQTSYRPCSLHFNGAGPNLSVYHALSEALYGNS